MFKKKILSISAFLITLTASLILALVIGEGFVLNMKNDPEASEAVYSFLKNDAKILHEMSDKLNSRERDQRNNWEIIKEFYEIREKQETANLPMDFKDAWERKILSDVEWINYVYHLRNFNKKGTLETEVERDIADEKISESSRLESEMVSIAKSYGIEFDKQNFLIEKN